MRTDHSWRQLVRASALAAACLAPAACANTTAAERGNLQVTGIVSGYASVNGMDGAAESFLDVGFLESSGGTTELLSLDFAPFQGARCKTGGTWLGAGIGFTGLRLQVLWFELGLGTLAYRPVAPPDRPCAGKSKSPCDGSASPDCAKRRVESLSGAQE